MATINRASDLYRKGFITWKEAFNMIIDHINELFHSGCISQVEAAACEKQVVRWYEGEISTHTLTTYIGAII